MHGFIFFDVENMQCLITLKFVGCHDIIVTLSFNKPILTKQTTLK